MDQKKRDQQQDQRQMPHDENRDLGNQRNEEETGEPVQLDKDSKEHQGDKDRQGGTHPQQPEHRPDQQGQRTGQRNA